VLNADTAGVPGPTAAQGIVHDLHAPLTIIRGLCAILGRDDPRFERRRVLEMMDAETLRLADGLRSLSRVTAPPGGPVATTDLADAASAAADRFAPIAAARGLRIAVRRAGRPSWVDGERGLIERVLDNLLQNAVRHAAPNGTIVLGVSRREGMASVRVRDDGAGVPVADRLRIFGRGERGSQAVGAGSGLGLAIAREIAGSCGGALTLDPVGDGACFRLSLPLTVVPPDGPRAA